ncbi:MAG: hypothetical protein M3333_05875 [Actinomycetota bacterium]|nr:hypothetical protein [Actinomycetota bacterium]
MKRSAGGGAHRGPVAPGRQRRAIRLVQVLLVLLAAGLLLFAGFSRGVSSGYRSARRAGDLGGAAPPSLAQTLVLAALGAGALGVAVSLQGTGGVRIPTPARLEELAGRAEATAVSRAGEAAEKDSTTGGRPEG